jgi:phenylacetate-CoA ligase
MNAVIEKIYFKSPIFLQNIMTSVYGYKLYRERYIGYFEKYLSELLKTQWYGKNEIGKFVENQFISIFQHAIKNVPFYQELVKTEKIKPGDIKRISDIEKLPIISKEHIRENPEYFLADGFKKKGLITINTSGTTGKTLKIFVDKDSRRFAYAFYSRLKTWAGIDSKLPNVTFAGRTIVPSDADKPPFWRRNLAWNNYLFSSYHLSPKNMKYYVDELKRIQPHFIDSYPSSIYTVAKYMKENSITGIHPKAIITSSETLLDYQREVIEDVFKCPVFDQYGCAEQVVFISQCEKGTYHIHPEFGIVEFLREDGSKAEIGEPARLICTGFTNRAMPLIRYDIGDTGVLSDKKCPCGRNFPVIEQIIGRTDDILITRDGRQIGRLDPVFKGLKSIKEAQIVQEDHDNIILRIIPGKDYQDNDGQIVVSELKKRLGSNVVIKVRIETLIERTSAGKFRSVISKVRKV